MSFSDKISELRNQLRELNKTIPETTKGFGALTKGTKDAGVLALKEKEYVALGIAIATRCEPCIMFHVDALMKAGGTREEMADVCAMAVQMGGGPALMYAAKALAVWDEFAQKD